MTAGSDIQERRIPYGLSSCRNHPSSTGRKWTEQVLSMVEYSICTALIWPIDNILRIKSSLSFCNTDAYLKKVRSNDPYKKIEVDGPLGLARG